jgi:hypothetical protein
MSPAFTNLRYQASADMLIQADPLHCISIILKKIISAMHIEMLLRHTQAYRGLDACKNKNVERHLRSFCRSVS